MSNLSHRERLHTSLLDRLTDDRPDRRSEGIEQRSLSEDELRSLVLRDLEWLFNTINFEAMESLDHVPQVQRSVINYGVPDMSGKTASGVDPRELTRQLREAILRFEPRLIAESVTVRATTQEAAHDRNTLAFLIDAQLWCQPVPLQLKVRTTVDLEMGLVAVKEDGD